MYINKHANCCFGRKLAGKLYVIFSEVGTEQGNELYLCDIRSRKLNITCIFLQALFTDTKQCKSFNIQNHTS